MAPEQATGDILTAAADWYAVGGLLFQALTGRLPFEGDAQAILDAKLAEDGPSPRDVNPDTPEAFDRICAKLLRRDPDERPSGQQIVDLLASRHTVPVSHRPRAFHERPDRTRRARRAPRGAREAHSKCPARTGRSSMLVHGPSGSRERPRWSNTSSMVSACATMCWSSRGAATRENLSATRRSTASSTSSAGICLSCRCAQIRAAASR